MTAEIRKFYGANLSEARRRARSALTEDDVVEEVLSDGEPITISASADTIAAAFSNGMTRAPDMARVVKKEEVVQPKEYVQPVEAFNETEAKDSARTKLPSSIEIREVAKVKDGRKGVLGLWRTPNAYQVRAQRLARIELTFQQDACIALVPKQRQYELPGLERSLAERLSVEDEEVLLHAKAALAKLGYAIQSSSVGLLRPKEVSLATCRFEQGGWVSFGWNNMEGAGTYEQIPVWSRITAFIGTTSNTETTSVDA